MYWYLKVLKNYAGFEGRARRKEYWYFALINSVISLALSFVEGAVGLFPTYEFSVLSIVYTLVIMLPSLAVGVRRLHDTGRSGWWLLISLVPIVGFIVVLIFLVQDSQFSENQYGPNPKRHEM